MMTRFDDGSGNNRANIEARILGVPPLCVTTSGHGPKRTRVSCHRDNDAPIDCLTCHK